MLDEKGNQCFFNHKWIDKSDLRTWLIHKNDSSNKKLVNNYMEYVVQMESGAWWDGTESQADRMAHAENKAKVEKRKKARKSKEDSAIKMADKTKAVEVDKEGENLIKDR